VLDRRLVEDVANRLRPGGEGLIEKDWHVVRAIKALAAEEISFTAGLDATLRLVELYARRGD
jgi:hypothetical protein